MRSLSGKTKTCTRLACTILLSILFFNSGFSEGTKQLAPTDTDSISLNINNDSYYNFARYGSTDEERLYIHIADPENEQVFLGFSEPYENGHYPEGDRLEAWFRILDPSGDVVYGPIFLDGTSSNISSHEQCVAGPSSIAVSGGYDPFVFDPSGLAAGDYYIEFNLEEEDYEPQEFFMSYFDITVASTDVSPVAKDGRLFAKNWGFFLPSISSGSDPTYSWYDRPFNGKLYAFSEEGFVSDIDFNGSGFQPAAFNISMNSSGTNTNGDIIDDRKSLNDGQGNSVQYKIFLNDPDNIVYPSGSFGELLADSTKLIGCAETGYYFRVATTKIGLIELLLDQNGGDNVYTDGTEDRVLAIDVTQQATDLVPNLYIRYIPWDGLDGLGNPVSVVSAVPTEISFSQGRYHIPVYDVEFNLNGFTSSIIRPTPPVAYTLKYYYDDTDIPDASGIVGQDNIDLEGCVPACHRWSNELYGDENTINTYWFAKQEFQSEGLVLDTDCGPDRDGDTVYDAIDIDWDNDGIPNNLESCNQPSSTVMTVKVGIQLDNFPAQTSWTIEDGGSVVVASGGPYTGRNYELIDSSITLTPGSYTFKINDSGSNGICCTDGSGYYLLTINQTQLIGGNGNGAFGASEMQAFTGTSDYYACLGNDPTIDSDFDGILNYLDEDFCTLNAHGICTLLDPDNDGIPSFLDLDADNDGIPDIIEAGGVDDNNDGEVDYPTVGDPTTMNDADNDGLADEYDPQADGAISNPDTDGDNVFDAFDLDSDNDGIADLIEVGGVDTDGDGMLDEMSDPDTGDTNDNGWGDATEAAILVDKQLSTDTSIDFDGDTYPNHLDIDSDNDGITDVFESNGKDGNGDGMADDDSVAGTITDANGDGWDDNYDAGTITSTADGADTNTMADFLIGSHEPDFDGDGLPNWLDIDADNDGLVDNSEGQATDSYITPTADSDFDGLNDAYEVAGTIGSFGGVGIDPVNTDAVADRPDFLDLDADEDQEPDSIEGHDTDGDAVPDAGSNARTGVYAGTDSDQDGLDDGYDNNIGSLDPTDGGMTPNSYVDFDDVVSPERDWRETSDIDLDNDGITNADEDGGTGFNPVEDADMDGVANFLDDNDVTVGFPNFVDSNNDGINDLFDADVDGVPDYIDLDADNDGIPDIVEAGGVDINGDGRADSLADDDGDGLVDTYDSGFITGVDIPNLDIDKDGIKDYIDLDADNDGIPDLVEAGGIDTNGDGRVDVNLDMDGDGLADIYDENANDGSGFGGINGVSMVETNALGIWQDGATVTSLDTDGDGHVDGLDLDADNDGIPDIVEAGGADDPGYGTVDTEALPWDADGDGLADLYDENASDGPVADGANGVALIKTTADTNDDGRVNASTELMIGGGSNVVNSDTDDIANHLDIDADNDGIVDIIEAGGNDTDGNGLVDDFNPASPATFDVVDNDGWSPTFDGDSANDRGLTTSGDGTPMIDTEDTNFDGYPESYTLGDSDSDKHPNFLDIDADDDGIVDNVEGQNTPAYTLPDNNDADGDGLDDAYDNSPGVFGGTGIDTNIGDATGTPNDHDTDGTPDYLDWDTDGDNIPDIQEAWDDMKDGDSQVDAGIGTCDGSDIDQDGLQDCFDSNTASSMVTSYKTPIDDNGEEGVGSVASVPTSGSNPSEIFPNNDTGDGQPDFRDILIDCGTQQVYYAITEKSTGTETEYEYVGDTHINLVDTSKVVRATTYCSPGDGWFYFYNPLEPENYLFAMRYNAAPAPVVAMHDLVDFIEIKVENDASKRHMVSGTAANLIMERDWRVEFKNTPTVGSTFDIKFYYQPSEMATLKAAADAVEADAEGNVVREFYWFKKENGVQNSNISPIDVDSMQDITMKDPDEVSDTNAGNVDGSNLTTGNGRNYVSFEGLSSFSGGTAGIKLTYASLPVELARFAATSKDCEVELDWVTASEEAFSHYEIERSEDGRDFNKIAEVEGQGGTNAFAYSFNDSGARLTNYYRLKMVDLDGSFEYSNIEIVILDCEQSDIKLFPNPVKDRSFVTLDFQNIQGLVNISIFDITGKRIKVIENHVNNDQVLLDVADLAQGTYLVQFYYNGKVEALKFVKLD